MHSRFLHPNCQQTPSHYILHALHTNTNKTTYGHCRTLLSKRKKLLLCCTQTHNSGFTKGWNGLCECQSLSLDLLLVQPLCLTIACNNQSIKPLCPAVLLQSFPTFCAKRKLCCHSVDRNRKSRESSWITLKLEAKKEEMEKSLLISPVSNLAFSIFPIWCIDYTTSGRVRYALLVCDCRVVHYVWD